MTLPERGAASIEKAPKRPNIRGLAAVATAWRGPSLGIRGLAWTGRALRRPAASAGRERPSRLRNSVDRDVDVVVVVLGDRPTVGHPLPAAPWEPNALLPDEVVDVQLGRVGLQERGNGIAGC